MVFPFGYLGAAIDMIFLILGMSCFFFFLVILGVFVIIILRNYNKNMWKVSPRNNILLISLILGVIVWATARIVLTYEIYSFGVEDPMLTVWLFLIILAIVFGAFFHSAVAEIGSNLGILFILLDLAYCGGLTIEYLASFSILFLIMFISGPYVSNRLIRGMLNYSIATVTLRIKTDVKAHEQMKKIKDIIEQVCESKYGKGKFNFRKEKRAGQFAISNKTTYVIPDIRLDFILKGPSSVPIIDALRGTIKHSPDYLPSAISKKATPHVSACIDAAVTIRTRVIIRGVVTPTEKGIIIALVSAEETSTKRYLSRRAKEFLIQFSRTLQKALKDAGIDTEIIPREESVIVYQWAPYVEGGEPSSEQGSIKKEFESEEKGIVAIESSDLSTDLHEILTTVMLVKDLFFIEDLWMQLRKMAYKKAIAVVFSLIASLLGIGG